MNKWILVKVNRPKEGYDDICDSLVHADFYENPSAFTSELLTETEAYHMATGPLLARIEHLERQLEEIYSQRKKHEHCKGCPDRRPDLSVSAKSSGDNLLKIP